MSELKEVEIYTDGACAGNPGPGGWGTILCYNGKEKELSGGEKNTTNNRMELMAVIEGLKALKYPCRVKVVSDSAYVCDGFNKGWVYSWEKKDWMRTKKDPVKNPDLWKELLELTRIHEVTFEWVKGHNDHPYNERCDKLAVEQSEKFIKQEN